MTLKDGLAESRKYFRRKETLSYDFRMEQLEKLQRSLEKHEEDVLAALKADLNKSRYEAFMSEIGLVYGELSQAKKKLKRWMSPLKVRPSLSQIPGKCRIYPEPYGVVLIISPWNYPFQLTLLPLIGAISAGNCVFIKPSAYSPETSSVMKKIVDECFDERYIRLIEGGRKENQELLSLHFDYIFFTGSPAVGHLVMEAAAKHLTPVTLELGGKSPCIIDRTADIEKTAKRIIFGKTMNSGQTCVAPDYLLVEKSIKEELIEEIKKTYDGIFSNQGYFADTSPSIINEGHFNRITALLKDQNIIFGGEIYEESRQMKLTLVDEPDWDSPLMSNEIFGPILPIVSWNNWEEVVDMVESRPKPLALYLFTKDKIFESEILKKLSFGGGCVNDTLLHITSSALPFGGVGESGMGRYHGRATFETFSHQKSVLHKSWLMDLALRHHPYKNPKKLLPKFLFRD